MIRKIIVFLFFPIVYIAGLCIGLHRVKSIWFRFAVTDNQIHLTQPEFLAFLDKNQCKQYWLETDLETFHKYFYDTFGATIDFHEFGFTRMLCFKSAAHKTWFILKYL